MFAVKKGKKNVDNCYRKSTRRSIKKEHDNLTRKNLCKKKISFVIAYNFTIYTISCFRTFKFYQLKLKHQCKDIVYKNKTKKKHSISVSGGELKRRQSSNDEEPKNRRRNIISLILNKKILYYKKLKDILDICLVMKLLVR